MVVIVAICIIVVTHKRNDKESLNNNEQGNIEEKTSESIARFKNTNDLKNFSNKATLPSGKEMTVNGLDMIVNIAMEDKFSKIQSGNGGTAYTQILTAIGPGEIKGFIIDEDIIGGYVVYYHYDHRTGTSMEGYYLYNKAFAIKVTNWNGLNNLRNNRI